ncbi:hypothetical protein Kisp02_13540 [Kineosporia sp. NBRC 101731]|nr:hypothetical protein Kisp02_13540 [Kineosporia sp. NBRC 101731]
MIVAIPTPERCDNSSTVSRRIRRHVARSVPSLRIARGTPAGVRLIDSVSGQKEDGTELDACSAPSPY